MIKLSEEHKENLRQILENEQWDSVLALVEQLIRRQEASVLNAPIDNSSRKIVIARASLEGARSIAAGLHNLKSELK